MKLKFDFVEIATYIMLVVAVVYLLFMVTSCSPKQYNGVEVIEYYYRLEKPLDSNYVKPKQIEIK